MPFSLSKPWKCSLVYFGSDSYMFGLSPVVEHGDDVAEQAIDRDFGFLKGKLAILDLGEFEDGVDDVQQMFA